MKKKNQTEKTKLKKIDTINADMIIHFLKKEMDSIKHVNVRNSN